MMQAADSTGNKKGRYCASLEKQNKDRKRKNKKETYDGEQWKHL
jgi:hypothetical protein